MMRETQRSNRSRHGQGAEAAPFYSSMSISSGFGASSPFSAFGSSLAGGGGAVVVGFRCDLRGAGSQHNVRHAASAVLT